MCAGKLFARLGNKRNIRPAFLPRRTGAMLPEPGLEFQLVARPPLAPFGIEAVVACQLPLKVRIKPVRFVARPHHGAMVAKERTLGRSPLFGEVLNLGLQFIDGMRILCH